jgi:hypothetical protein
VRASSLLERWITLWSRREGPEALALVRIFVAAAVLGDLLVAWHLDLVPDLWAPPPLGLGFGAASRNLPWSLALVGTSPASIVLIWLWTVLSAALLLIGALTPFAGLSLALASAQLSLISPSADRGIDDLLRIVSVLLGLSGAGAIWSVDAWVQRALGRPVVTRILAWPRYLVLLQLLWVYFSAAQHRGDEDWWFRGGLSALGKILSDPHFARLRPGLLGEVYPVTQAGTIGTMLFELSAPLMLLWIWYERTPKRPGLLRRAAVLLRFRWLWMAVGISFHLGIALTMRLGVFPFGMLALYPALFHPREVRAALDAACVRVIVTGTRARAGTRVADAAK